MFPQEIAKVQNGYKAENRISECACALQTATCHHLWQSHRTGLKDVLPPSQKSDLGHQIVTAA